MHSLHEVYSRDPPKSVLALYSRQITYNRLISLINYYIITLQEAENSQLCTADTD